MRWKSNTIYHNNNLKSSLQSLAVTHPYFSVSVFHGLAGKQSLPIGPQTFRNHLTATTQILTTTNDPISTYQYYISPKYTHPHISSFPLSLYEAQTDSDLHFNLWLFQAVPLLPAFGFQKKKIYAYQLHPKTTLLTLYYIIVFVYDIIEHSTFCRWNNHFCSDLVTYVRVPDEAPPSTKAKITSPTDGLLWWLRIVRCPSPVSKWIPYQENITITVSLILYN
jgi:hypothetical protein